MKKLGFLIVLLAAQMSNALVKEYTEASVGGCDGVAVFKPEGEIKSIINNQNPQAEVLISQDKDYVMISSKEDARFIVNTISGKNYRVSFNSKSCQMPSKSYEGCFSKKQDINFSNKISTIFYPESKSFSFSEKTLTVSDLKEKHKIIYIQEQGSLIKPILLINKCS